MPPSTAPRNMCAPWRAHDIPKCPSLARTRTEAHARRAVQAAESAIADQSEIEVLRFLLQLIAHAHAICAADRASHSRTIDGSENTPLTPGLAWLTE